MKLILALMGLVAGLLALSPSAPAGSCERSRIELPVRLVANLPVVSLTIENKAVSFILDTGAERTVIAPEAANRLHLRQDRAYPRRLRSLGGAMISGDVALPRFAGAGMALRNFGALVGSTPLPSLGGVTLDGLLGADILSGFAVDLDLPHGRVDLYDGLSCSAPAGIWGQRYTAIPANRSLHDRLFFSATLDGRRIAAAFDTGGRRSVLDIRAARSPGTGRPLDGGPAVTLRGMTGSVQAHAYRFRELVFAGQRLRDPVLLVAPLDLDDADLLLGVDFLRTRRVWLSYQSPRIFLGERTF